MPGALIRFNLIILFVNLGKTGERKYIGSWKRAGGLVR
jgi:hypothetical protein